MRLTPDQLKMLFRAWDAGKVDVPESSDSDPLGKGRTIKVERRNARVLEKMGLIHRVGSVIGLNSIASFTSYEITRRGTERLLDPAALMAREVIES